MPRIDLLTSELHALLVPVLPHASTEKDDHRGLNVVRFEIHNEVLYTIATDRHTLAAHRHPLGDIDDYAVSIGRDHAANLLKTFKFNAKHDPELTIILDEMTIPGEGQGPGIRVDSEDHVRVVYGAAILGGEPAPFMNWRGFLAKALARPLVPAGPMTGVNGQLLARWPKASPGEALRLFTAPDDRATGGHLRAHPIIVLAGDTIGLLMPVTLDEEPVIALSSSPWANELADATHEDLTVTVDLTPDEDDQPESEEAPF